MNNPRLCDKETVPSFELIYSYLGPQATEAWLQLTRFAEQNYDHVSELIFGGKNYGWNLRYRKSGKTLFSMFPEQDRFTVLLVLGKKEIQAYEERIHEFGEFFKHVYESASQYHDGRWLWIGIDSVAQINDIEKMIMIKRKPITSATKKQL
ncbi:DUF3788 domain-containing protein [Paenibacillus donghaensis]|nr:DUF3788 domain-containing protein [Paenibacillus donghaensis]